MIRECVICGENKRRTYLGKRNVWNAESKQKLSQKGQTSNLKSGTDGAKKEYSRFRKSNSWRDKKDERIHRNDAKRNF